MKKLVFLLFVIQFFIGSINGQVCVNGDVTLTTQLMVDNFVSVYSSTCTEINGKLTIDGSGINDVSGLSFITKVNSLKIENSTLADVSGVTGISECTSINITSNNFTADNLTFPNLVSIENIWIWDNSAIKKVEFSSLIDADFISVIGNPIDTVNYPLLADIDYAIQISNFPTGVSGNGLQISNSKVESVDFSSLDSVENVYIYKSFLRNLDGLSSLRAVRDRLQIIENKDLMNIDGLSAFEKVRFDLDIIDNDLILNIDGLSNFKSTRFLNIEGNAKLTNLNGLVALDTITSLFVSYNSKLSDISGLASLNTLNRLSITGNGSLLDLNGLQGYTKIQWLDIINNNNLTDISAASHLNLQNLYLNDNNKLPSITLTGTVIDYIEIDNNNSLTEIGFPNLVQGERFAVINNNVLTDICSSNELLFITNLQVEHNPLLSNCCCIGNIRNIAGSLAISDNDIGCQSYTEILQECLESDDDGIPNTIDNCPDTYNPNQDDQDGDGIGDSCDNCPTVANNTQADANSDGIGDDCELLAGPNTGLVGIGTNQPKSKLEVVDGDVYIQNFHRGIILKGADGNCYRLTVGENGAVMTNLVNCP